MGFAGAVADWQLNRAFETDTAEMLERVMNSDDDFPAKEISSDLKQADFHLEQAIMMIARSGDLADRWEKGERIYDFLAKLEDYRIDLRNHRKELCREK